MYSFSGFKNYFRSVSHNKKSIKRNKRNEFYWLLKWQTSRLWRWWWIIFVVWLTKERHLALFPARTIVRDPQHCESPTHHKQDWTCAEPEFRFVWIKLCSNDNHYTLSQRICDIIQGVLCLFVTALFWPTDNLGFVKTDG